MNDYDNRNCHNHSISISSFVAPTSTTSQKNNLHGCCAENIRKDSFICTWFVPYSTTSAAHVIVTSLVLVDYLTNQAAWADRISTEIESTLRWNALCWLFFHVCKKTQKYCMQSTKNHWGRTDKYATATALYLCALPGKPKAVCGWFVDLTHAVD